MPVGWSSEIEPAHSARTIFFVTLAISVSGLVGLVVSRARPSAAAPPADRALVRFLFLLWCLIKSQMYPDLLRATPSLLSPMQPASVLLWKNGHTDTRVHKPACYTECVFTVCTVAVLLLYYYERLPALYSFKLRVVPLTSLTANLE